ncbi:hypothetical protein ACHAW6_006775 [Cyclotella cf. meneghiniana]
MLNPRNDLPPSFLELLILGSYIILAEDPHSMTLNYLRPYQRGTRLFHKYMSTPTNAEEEKGHMCEFAMAGLPGYTGSLDASHNVHEKCSYHVNRIYKGCKSKTQQEHSTSVQTIIFQSYAQPLVILDLELIRPCCYLTSFFNGSIMQDNQFEMLEEQNGKVVSVKYKSIESIRKDVECTFGILNLKSVICSYSTDTVDNIWNTCCDYTIYYWSLMVECVHGMVLLLLPTMLISNGDEVKLPGLKVETQDQTVM